jgi:hypothetical protein
VKKKVESLSSVQPFEDFGETCIFPLGVGFKKKDDNLQMAKVINWLINWNVAIGIQTKPLITFSRLLSVEISCPQLYDSIFSKSGIEFKTSSNLFIGFN